MMEHLHILEPLEGVRQDVPLSLGIGVAALGIDAVGLFHHQPSCPASLIELPEVGDDIAEFHPAFVVGKQQHCFEQHRLVGVAHVHLPHHIQEQILAVGVVDERPAVLFCILLECFLFEIFESPVLAHGHHQVGHQQTVPDISLDGLRLYIHPADKLHLGDHAGGLILPVEDVHQFVVQGVHRPVDECIRALAAVVKALLSSLLLLGAQHQRTGLVVFQPEQPVHGVGHVVLAGVVYKVEHHQTFLTGEQPHTAAQLLGVEHLGHGGPGHEQHLGSWAVPAFVEQVTGAQYLGLALLKPGQYLPSLTGLNLAGHGLGGYASVMKPPGDLLGMLDRGAEDDRPLVLHVLKPGVHDELVPLGHIDFALQIPDVVLDAVEPNLGQIDVGVDADTPHRHQLADLHGDLNVQLVGCILENVQDILVVSPLRRGGQTQGKFRCKIGQDPLICIGGGVVCLIHDDVAEVIWLEPFQVQGHALDAAADHKGVALFRALHVAAYGDPGPQCPESLGGLIHQLHRVSQKQRPLAESLGIHDGGHRFAGASGVVEKGDGFKVAAHLLQRCQGLLLMLLKLQLGAVQRLAPLGGEVVLDLLEAGVLSQKYSQLVLHGLRLLLHLPHCPAIHIPAQVNHAVLLEQVIVEFVLGDQLWVVRGLIVNLNGNLPSAILNQKVSKPTVLVDVGEGVLGVEIAGFLGAEGIGEQFDKQIFGTAAGDGTIGGHRGHLVSL